MTIHVDITDAELRLSELFAAAVRGEEVILQGAGSGQVRLMPVAETSRATRDEIVAKRLSALGMWRDRVGDVEIDVRALKMTDDELEEREQRKFGPAA